ncbi:hypothetical protein ACA910_002848 [Epithemia clementina (nom. ined.)]
MDRLRLPQRLSVLFVDDDMMLRKLFKRAIQRVAPLWEIEEAGNGETALRLADERNKAFELIFMDMYMASGEKQLLGTETVRAFRSKGVTSIICGLSANNMEIPFLESGTEAFMIKPLPCEKEALVAQLVELLRCREEIDEDGTNECAAPDE